MNLLLHAHLVSLPLIIGDQRRICIESWVICVVLLVRYHSGDSRTRCWLRDAFRSSSRPHDQDSRQTTGTQRRFGTPVPGDTHERLQATCWRCSSACSGPSPDAAAVERRDRAHCRVRSAGLRVPPRGALRFAGGDGETAKVFHAGAAGKGEIVATGGGCSRDGGVEGRANAGVHREISALFGPRASIDRTSAGGRWTSMIDPCVMVLKRLLCATGQSCRLLLDPALLLGSAVDLIRRELVDYS
jgi:hypothetical protein